MVRRLVLYLLNPGLLTLGRLPDNFVHKPFNPWHWAGGG
jgi:hypothetical protein